MGAHPPEPFPATRRQFDDPGAPTAVRLFGVNLETRFPFTTPLTEASGPPDLRLQVTTVARSGRTAPGKLVYTSPFRTPAGEPAGELYQTPFHPLLRLRGLGDFTLEPHRIQALLPPKPDLALVESQFLGLVLTLWLEFQRVPCLHAAAVVADGVAVGFLSDSGQGKSTLAAALMESGCPLLSDDILAVDITENGAVGRAGYPQLRLWPDEATYLIGAYEHLQRVHPSAEKRRLPVGPGDFGRFHSEPAPLRCLYVPERLNDDAPPALSPLNGREALVELIRYSFAARLVEAAGLQPVRLGQLAALVSPAAGVSYRRLRYPSGFQHLAAVREAVLGDVARLKAADP